MNIISTCHTGIATILTCRKIAHSFGENIYELSSIRRNWSPEYAESLKERIETIINSYYTKESLSDHLEKHTQLHELIVAALTDITVLRAQLKVDFRYDKQFLKDTFEKLGYNDYYSEAKIGDYVSLYHLMTTCRKNLDADLQQVIQARGINQNLVQRLLFSYREKLADLKNCFDVSHGEDELESELKKEINAIYSEIRDICRIVSAYYEFYPVRRDEFNFYKVLIGLKKSMLLYV